MSIWGRIFGGKKPAVTPEPVTPPARPDKEQLQASEARKRGQTLLLELTTQLTAAHQNRCDARKKELEVIRVARKQGEILERTKYPISDEDLQKYAVDIAALHCGLSHAAIQYLDSREIDEEISKLASQMLEAVKQERATVAEDAFEGLCWAVTVGRSDIPETELDTMDDVITARMNIFEAYQTCVISANSAEDAQKKLDSQRAQLAILKSDHEKVLEKLRNIPCYEDVRDELKINSTYKGENEEEKLVIKIITNEEAPIINSIDSVIPFMEQNSNLANTYRYQRVDTKIAILNMTGKQYPNMAKNLDKIKDYVEHNTSYVFDIIQDMIRSQRAFNAMCKSIQKGPMEKLNDLEAIRRHLEEEEKREAQEQKRKEREEAAAEKKRAEANRVANEEKRNQRQKTTALN